jgi:heme exporter protein C
VTPLPPPTKQASRLVLAWAAGLTSTAAAVAALLIAPQDAIQGPAQRLMYVHVPAAWLAYLAFTVVLISSIGYLVRRDPRWDRRAQAAAEIGVGATALAIVLGSLWGRPVWGVWWVWDPRLVTTVVLLLVYAGYLGVRGLSDDPALNARRAAAVGVVGFADLPVVHFSVIWWRAVHQPPTLLQPGTSPPIETSMLLTLLLAVAAFTLLGVLAYVRRLDVLAAQAITSADTPGSATSTAAEVDGAEHSQPVHVRVGGRR